MGLLIVYVSVANKRIKAYKKLLLLQPVFRIYKAALYIPLLFTDPS